MNDWLAEQARVSPNKTALVWGARAWTYGELEAEVVGMAARLGGVKRGEHVAVLMPNRPEYVFAIHALARLGAVLVPLNTRLTEVELRWQADHADCSVVLCSKETEAQAVPLLDQPRRVLLSVDQPARPEVKALQTVEADVPATAFDLQAMQSIVFTSGTTGYPKGAMLTFENLFWSATASAARLGSMPDDRWLLCMPLYHVGGMSIVFRCCLYGTAVVLMEKFEVEKVNEVLETGGVTLASFVPTMLRRLLDVRRGDAPRSLWAVLLGGAAASPDLLAQAFAAGWPLAVTYGLTEACSQVATIGVSEAKEKAGSVGKPLMFTEVKIVEGEVVVRGPGVMRGYYRNEDATSAALREGWLFSGDLGYLDEDGDLWIVDRRGDLIVTGGENVAPTEVERVLLAFPGVREACVVGVTDAEWCQRVVAVIVGEVDREALLRHCRAHLAGYKIPREVRFVEGLPQTASGKVKRGEVRKGLEEEGRCV
ncbi:MAG TPA: o-succinylbenzoate--CoA ligase [Anaerolineales bacterium]|nr:o-succinylbenzoate--CoA ligase [Anaerolineales bacterium]